VIGSSVGVQLPALSDVGLRGNGCSTRLTVVMKGMNRDPLLLSHRRWCVFPMWVGMNRIFCLRRRSTPGTPQCVGMSRRGLRAASNQCCVPMHVGLKGGLQDGVHVGTESGDCHAQGYVIEPGHQRYLATCVSYPVRAAADARLRISPNAPVTFAPRALRLCLMKCGPR